MRKKSEILIDKILLLYLFSVAEKTGGIDGRLKFQKLVFLSELKLLEKEIKSLHFKFFRHYFGPFSKELWIEYDDLKNKKLVNINYTLPEKTKYFLDYVTTILKEINCNIEIFNIINDTCRKYGRYSGRTLTNIVYKMEIIPHDLPGEKMKIKDIPSFFDILVPEFFESSWTLEIPEFLLKDIRSEFEMKDLKEDEIERLMEETEDRLIKEIKNKVGRYQKEAFIKSLEKEGASKKLLNKFTQS